MKTNKFAAALSVIAAICVLLSSCALQEKSDPVIGEIEFQNTHTVYSLHGKVCKEYLSGDYASISEFASADSDESRPLPVKISWQDVGCDSYTVQISDRPDFSSYHGGACKTENLIRPESELYNLMVGRKYYVRVFAYSGERLCAEGTFSFETADETVRPVCIDGAINARDLGGYELKNGRKIKQGMLYRSGRFGYADENGIFCEITDTGKAQIYELGIKSEIDLRGGKDGKTDEMGTDTVAENGGFGIGSVRYRKIPMGYDASQTKSGTLLELDVNKKAFYKIFTLLADENSYPLLFHCNIGTDRTGAVSFLILSLLGASRDDIYKDYCLSQLAPIGKSVDPDVISGYFAYIEDRYGGKCENYLADIGISQEQISKIRQILTE